MRLKYERDETRQRHQSAPKAPNSVTLPFIPCISGANQKFQKAPIPISSMLNLEPQIYSKSLNCAKAPRLAPCPLSALLRAAAPLPSPRSSLLRPPDFSHNPPSFPASAGQYSWRPCQFDSAVNNNFLKQRQNFIQKLDFLAEYKISFGF